MNILFPGWSHPCFSSLKHLKIYSQPRRSERYKISYTLKVLEGLVTNCGIKFYTNKGEACNAKSQKVREDRQSRS